MRVDDKSFIFEELTPPAGGLDSLRARLDQEPFRRRRVRRTAGAVPLALATAGIVMAMLIPQGSSPVDLLDGNNPDLVLANPTLIRFGLAQAPAAPVTIRSDQRHRMALQQVEVTDPDVLFYRIAVLPEPADTEPASS